MTFGDVADEYLSVTCARRPGGSAGAAIGPRLRAELAMLRHGPDGKEHGANAYVFGNEVGEPVRCTRRSWEAAVLKAHDLAVERKRGKLTPASQTAYASVDLHFHDLRREFASRLLESSADIHDVALFLGHANVGQTSTYLRSTPTRLKAALDRMEEAEGFAHYSHTEAPEGRSEPSERTSRSSVKH